VFWRRRRLRRVLVWVGALEENKEEEEEKGDGTNKRRSRGKGVER
jgi:hypothetical protein